MFVRNDTVVLNIVLGDSIPLPSGFRNGPCQGCSNSTKKPITKQTTLNHMNARQYCFQFCGPVSRVFSNQRNQAGAR